MSTTFQERKSDLEERKLDLEAVQRERSKSAPSPKTKTLSPISSGISLTSVTSSGSSGIVETQSILGTEKPFSLKEKFLQKMKIKDRKKNLEKRLNDKLIHILIDHNIPYWRFCFDDPSPFSAIVPKQTCPSMTVFNSDDDKEGFKKVLLYPIAMKLSAYSILPEQVAKAARESGNVSFVAQTAQNGFSLHPEFAIFTKKEIDAIIKVGTQSSECIVEVFTYNPNLKMQMAHVTLLNSEDNKEKKVSADENKSMELIETNQQKPVEIICFSNLKSEILNKPSPFIIQGLDPKMTEHFFSVVTPTNGKSPIVTYHWILSAEDCAKIIQYNWGLIKGQEKICLAKYVDDIPALQDETLRSPLNTLKSMIKPVWSNSLLRQFRAGRPVSIKNVRASIEALQLEGPKMKAAIGGASRSSNHSKTDFRIQTKGRNGLQEFVSIMQSAASDSSSAGSAGSAAVLSNEETIGDINAQSRVFSAIRSRAATSPLSGGASHPKKPEAVVTRINLRDTVKHLRAELEVAQSKEESLIKHKTSQVSSSVLHEAVSLQFSQQAILQRQSVKPEASASSLEQPKKP